MDGLEPSNGALVQDAAGNLYGATEGGGAYSGGVVFKLDSLGQETVLYSFCALYPGPCEGSGPNAGLIQDAAGNLYGTAPFGDGNSGGTVFEVDATGHETVLRLFGFPGCVSSGGCARMAVIPMAASSGMLWATYMAPQR